MRLRSCYHIATAIFAIAIATAGCDGATAPATPREAAGVYVLESVSGRGPVSGSMTLTSAGGAERRVKYAANPSEFSATGSFEILPAGIRFDLKEQAAPAGHTWDVRGEWNGRRFTLRYPDPADGPDIVETFRRR